MGIRESLLNTITSVGSSDFVRIVTSAGASSKATLQNVIKSFETGLGAKSNLSTSDYIRVVGSDNNLYKQSVSAMATTMGIDDLVSDVDALGNKIGNTKTIYVTKTITLPAGSISNPSVTTIDLTDVLPSSVSGSILGIDVWLGTFHLPYVTQGGYVGTWVAEGYTRIIKIKNAANVWENYMLYACVTVSA